eukprot:GHVN01066765.1.p1 GENE.GHVN01066765.1~~GHVN01066765.1.p1  ORF type:complete len:617 (-),score=122.84 GHVN01066765.1:711-2324(-)
MDGPFTPKGEPSLKLEGDLVARCLSFPEKDRRVAILSGKVSDAYASRALAEACSQTMSGSMRSMAAARFVEAPSTGHQEVVELLRQLASRKDQESDASLLLIEAVILSVFKTDAAWPVLGYLLSPEVIATQPQRMTAAVLANIQQWVPADAAVRVLKVLLSPDRRHAVKFALHKAIIRMLFDAGSKDACSLLEQEWERRVETKLGKDVVHEFVTQCIKRLHTTSLASSSTSLASSTTSPDSNTHHSNLITKTSWKIVEDCAGDNSIDGGTLLLLLLPTWLPKTKYCNWDKQFNLKTAKTLSYNPKHPLSDKATQRFLELYCVLKGETLIELPNGDMNPRFLRLLETMSNSSSEVPIRLFAKLKKFTFTSPAMGVSDAQVLTDLHQSITRLSADSEGSIIDLYEAEATSYLLAHFTQLVMSEDVEKGMLNHKTASRQQMQKIVFGNPHDAKNGETLTPHLWISKVEEMLRTIYTSLTSTPASSRPKNRKVLSHIAQTCLSDLTKDKNNKWIFDLLSHNLKRENEKINQEITNLQGLVR